MLSCDGPIETVVILVKTEIIHNDLISYFAIRNSCSTAIRNHTFKDISKDTFK